MFLNTTKPQAEKKSVKSKEANRKDLQSLPDNELHFPPALSLSHICVFREGF